jgi:hypothetical protein
MSKHNRRPVATMQPACFVGSGSSIPARSRTGIDCANPRVVESRDVVAGSPYLACAIGDEDALRVAKHGHDDNVCATLAWASCNESSENGDRAGCSRALLEHGMSGATLGPDNPKRVLIASRRGRFTDVLLQMRDLP